MHPSRRITNSGTNTGGRKAEDSLFVFKKGVVKKRLGGVGLVGCHKMAGGCEGLTGRVIRAIKVARSVIEGSRRGWGRRQPVASLFTREPVHGSCAYINWLSPTRHRGGV